MCVYQINQRHPTPFFHCISYCNQQINKEDLILFFFILTFYVKINMIILFNNACYVNLRAKMFDGMSTRNACNHYLEWIPIPSRTPGPCKGWSCHLQHIIILQYRIGAYKCITDWSTGAIYLLRNINYIH